MTKKQAMLRGLLICVPVIATVVATVFALEQWWPTPYAGVISGLAGVVVLLLCFLIAFRNNATIADR